jgi:DNA repair protein RadC
MEDNCHSGHRKRLRENYIMGGSTAMHEYSLLELLLTYAIPRKDVNPLAHELIERYGSLERVLSAPVEELMKLDGIGENAAVLLSLAGSLRSLPAAQTGRRIAIATPEEAARYCETLFAGKGKYEAAYCVCLDKRRRVIHYDLLSMGTLTENVIYPRLVVEFALRHGANSVILTHNHPSGNPAPSRADLASTKSVCEALSGIGITLHDHIIVGAEGNFSMLRNMLLPTGERPEALARAAEKEDSYDPAGGI